MQATNKNLEEQVRLGKFRKDLYYRLSVVKINTTPLRKRKEDLEDLFRYFCILLSHKPLSITKLALRKLENHSWEGNLRELRNVAERTILQKQLFHSSEIDYKDIELEELNNFENNIYIPTKISDISKESYYDFLKQTQKLYYDKALKVVGGDIHKLVDRIGLGRSTVFRHVKELKIRKS